MRLAGKDHRITDKLPLRNQRPSGKRRFAGCMVYGHKNKHQGYRPREEWIIQPDCFPAIISMKEAEKAYQISVSKQGRKGQKAQYLLSGLLKCQVCGNNFQMDFDKRNHHRCSSTFFNSNITNWGTLADDGVHELSFTPV